MKQKLNLLICWFHQSPLDDVNAYYTKQSMYEEKGKIIRGSKIRSKKMTDFNYRPPIQWRIKTIVKFTIYRL